MLVLLFTLSLVGVANGQSTVRNNYQGACNNGYNALILSKLDSIITLFNDGHNVQTNSEFKDFPPVDCQQILDTGASKGSGAYSIYNPVDPAKMKDVYCDMETDGGGWLVFQRRIDDTINFDTIWAQYTTGFGDVTGNLWLGNELLNRLTNYKKQELRIDLQNWENVTAYAKYQVFKVDSEANKYRLSVSGFSGSAGDSLSYHNGAAFSTKDRDQDTSSTLNCAKELQGAWWFQACETSSLNGPYYQTETIDPTHYHGVSWDSFGGEYTSLKYTEMKIRPT